MQIGIIGGTGLASIGEAVQAHPVRTDYGEALVEVVRLGGQEVAFIARHGREHHLPPHLVNYRANIAALKSLGVTRLLASAAVGSLNEAMQPGDFVLPTQFIDFTRGRRDSFHDAAGSVQHIDLTVPYCPLLREQLERAGRFLGGGLHPAAVYVCTQGPRFETPAEIEMFRRLGGDLVGMTGVPEAPLAREAGLCYAALAVVTNWAAGLSQEPLDHHQVTARMSERMDAVKRIFSRVIETWQDQPCPTCHRPPTEACDLAP